MRKSATEDLVTPFAEPEREFHQRLRARKEMAGNNGGGIPPRRTIADYAKPSLDGARSSIVRPAVEANNFTIPPQITAMIQNSINGVSKDVIKLRLFPFSLTDRAMSWLDSLPVGSIATWADMTNKFLLRYFPPSKNARMRSNIHAYMQEDGESFHETWERFKELLRKCPHHGLELWQQLEALTKKIDRMQVNSSQQCCDTCGGAHATTDCMQRDHLDSLEQFQPRQQSLFQNEGSSNSAQPEKKETMEEMLARYLAVTDARHLENQTKFKEHEIEMRNQKAAIQNIERHLGQITTALSERQQGTFPANTEKNPKEHVKAVMTRSGKTTQLDETVVVSKPVDEEEEETEPEVKVQNTRLSPASTARPKEVVKPYQPPLPYPGRLRKEKMEEEYGKFLGIFKQLHINLPFVEALAQMPKYAKFLKDLLTNKKKLEEFSTVTLSEECSAILQNKLPAKMSDPGSFTIPCLISSLSVSNALADLGANINLMPYSVFAKLDLGEPTPTRMSIQLADRSVKYPRGIMENMLVKVGKFVFPADFVILDMDKDEHVPLILGRPFLATSRALIDVFDGKLTLRVDEDTITFDIKKSMRHTKGHDDTLYFIDTIMSHVGCCLQEICEKDSLDIQILSMMNQEVVMTNSSFEQESSDLDSNPSYAEKVFEVMERKEPEGCTVSWKLSPDHVSQDYHQELSFTSPSLMR
ncbi:hypothetical protein E3N88_28687 [Mikania micrantha]|uniref:Retrotransposon gag domain-containing protein n=1 Tax=Mikania micrantha TaxID=192012 RepID=A0A5N6N163_9ASTR|nr:hypothetical protein E3N88_28687 [Mikania micrantha]